MYKINLKQGQQMGLMKALHFSDKDLDANRNGRLSDAQKHTLQGGQRLSAVFWWVLTIIGSLTLAFPGQFIPDNAINRLFVVLGIVSSLCMAFWNQYRTAQIIKADEVAYVTGAIKTSERRENNRKVYRAIVGEKKFKIAQNVYDWLLEGSVYTFYYVPQTNTLLSIELPLSTEEEQRLEDENKLAEKKKRLAETGASAEMLNTEDTESGLLFR